MIMQHVLIILTLTSIQGHTGRNHEKNKCLIISETILAMPIKYALQIVRLKIYMTIASSRSQVRLKLDYYLTCSISNPI